MYGNWKNELKVPLSLIIEIKSTIHPFSAHWFSSLTCSSILLQYEELLTTAHRRRSPNKHIDIDHANDKSCKAFYPTYVSIEENNPLTNLQIAPNPTTSFIQITIPELKSPITILITDISGKEIKRDVIDKTTSSLSLSEINPGMYFLKFNFANQSVVKKIIKQ